MNIRKSIKSFFSFTKFLWIGGVIGVAQQFLGRLDYILYKGKDIFSFSSIMGSIGFYAVLILLLIFRNTASPKKQFRDLFLFFLGLDFVYYLYIFILEFTQYLHVKTKSPDIMHEISFYFQNTTAEIIDFTKWTIIGTAAAIWGYFTVKLRNANKKKMYILMLAPLFLVLFAELIDTSAGMANYIIQEYKKIHNIPLPKNYFYTCPIALLLTDLTGTAICLTTFIKRRNTNPRKNR